MAIFGCLSSLKGKDMTVSEHTEIKNTYGVFMKDREGMVCQIALTTDEYNKFINGEHNGIIAVFEELKTQRIMDGVYYDHLNIRLQRG